MNREEALRALRDKMFDAYDDPNEWEYGDLVRWVDAVREAFAILDASPWIPVAEALPDTGRRCWVWIQDIRGSRKLLATRQVAVNGATWWHDVRGEGLSRWRIVCWQYEVVPADPCREES